MNIDRQKFTQWLQNKEPSDSVGTGCDTSYCPTARYANTLSGVSETEVGWLYIRAVNEDNEEIEFTYPCWLHNFIRTVDRLFTTKNVTAYRALTILKELPK